jgi:hypothetical protein
MIVQVRPKVEVEAHPEVVLVPEELHVALGTAPRRHGEGAVLRHEAAVLAPSTAPHELAARNAVKPSPSASAAVRRQPAELRKRTFRNMRMPNAFPRVQMHDGYYYKS